MTSRRLLRKNAAAVPADRETRHHENDGERAQRSGETRTAWILRGRSGGPFDDTRPRRQEFLGDPHQDEGLIVVLLGVLGELADVLEKLVGELG